MNIRIGPVRVGRRGEKEVVLSTKEEGKEAEESRGKEGEAAFISVRH